MYLYLTRYQGTTTANTIICMTGMYIPIMCMAALTPYRCAGVRRAGHNDPQVWRRVRLPDGHAAPRVCLPLCLGVGLGAQAVRGRCDHADMRRVYTGAAV